MAETIRILMVEDDLRDAELAQRQIQQAGIFCTFLRVDSKDAVIYALREFVPDVILTDHSLPQFGARDALKLAQQLSPGTPVIVLTGGQGDEPAVQYLQAGAADYIVKDHLDRLGPAVLLALDTKHSREAQARAHQLQTAIYRLAQLAMSTPGLDQFLPAMHRIVGELMTAQQPDPHLRDLMVALESQIGQFIERRRAEGALADPTRTAELAADIEASLVETSPFGSFQSAPDGPLQAGTRHW